MNLLIIRLRLIVQASFEFGRALHGYILKSTNIEPNVTLAGALIHMYMKCGCVADAKLVSESVIAEDCSMRCHGLLTYSAHGLDKNGVALFKEREIWKLS